MLFGQLRIANCETQIRNSQFTIGLTGIILLGWLLRLPLLARFPFREDEAIYSYWALHFWQVDPFFLQVWPDKPPVFLVLLAVVFQLLGINQISAQWLNIAISTLTIPVVAMIARRSWGHRAGIVAALAFALNPFAISFAATAYTDPLLVLTGLLAGYFALAWRPFWAGLWLALAIMTKQQGILYVPLVASYLLSSHLRPQRPSHRPHRLLASSTPALTIHYSPFTINSFLFFFLGFALITLPILYWDSLRWAVAPSPWDLSIRHYGALALVPLSQWGARLTTWLPLLWYLTASGIVWGGLVLLLVGLVLRPAWARRNHLVTPSASSGQALSPCHLVTRSPCLLLLGWSLFFLLAHLLTSVQPWDRYLLPLAPVVALGMGWVAARWASHLPARWWASGLCAGLLVMTPPAWQAATGRLPIGGDHGAYTGLMEALEWVKREELSPLILYQRVLGWHYRFYLYEQMTSGAYDLRWFPNPVYLAANAAQAAGQPRILIEPDWAATRDLRPRLAQQGLQLKQLARFGRFIVYQPMEQRLGLCRWCFCGLPFTLTPLTTEADPVMMSVR